MTSDVMSEYSRRQVLRTVVGEAGDIHVVHYGDMTIVEEFSDYCRNEGISIVHKDTSNEAGKLVQVPMPAKVESTVTVRECVMVDDLDGIEEKIWEVGVLVLAVSSGGLCRRKQIEKAFGMAERRLVLWITGESISADVRIIQIWRIEGQICRIEEELRDQKVGGWVVVEKKRTWATDRPYFTKFMQIDKSCHDKVHGSEVELSVVIPACNAGKYLAHCLLSLENQTADRNCYEVILVDNGSTDNTQEIASKYRCRIVHESMRGAGAARNRGALEARSNYIVFIDADCVAHPALVTEYIREAKDGLLCGGGRIIGYRISNCIDAYCYKRFWDQQKTTQGLYVGVPPYAVTANAIFRKDVLLSVGGFSTAYYDASGEDLDIGIRLSNKHIKISYLPKCIVYHQHRTTFKALYFMGYKTGMGRAEVSHRHKLSTFTAKSVRGLLWQMSAIPFGIVLSSKGSELKCRYIYDLGIIAGHIWWKLRPTYSKESVDETEINNMVLLVTGTEHVKDDTLLAISRHTDSLCQSVTIDRLNGVMLYSDDPNKEGRRITDIGAELQKTVKKINPSVIIYRKFGDYEVDFAVQKLRRSAHNSFIIGAVSDTKKWEGGEEPNPEIKAYVSRAKKALIIRTSRIGLFEEQVRSLSKYIKINSLDVLKQNGYESEIFNEMGGIFTYEGGRISPDVFCVDMLRMLGEKRYEIVFVPMSSRNKADYLNVTLLAERISRGKVILISDSNELLLHKGGAAIDWNKKIDVLIRMVRSMISIISIPIVHIVLFRERR